MAAGVRFAYTGDSANPAALLPRLPLTLHHGDRSLEVLGLLDTGATVNVLPYQAGHTLGARWDEQAVAVQLSGSLGRFEARALILFASHPRLIPGPSVRLVFAWAQTDDIPVILGQVNFFLAFDVCFFRADSTFEATRRGEHV
jgi:hypothetical protein